MQLVQRFEAWLDQLATVDLDTWLIIKHVRSDLHCLLFAALALADVKKRAVDVMVLLLRESLRHTGHWLRLLILRIKFWHLWRGLRQERAVGLLGFFLGQEPPVRVFYVLLEQVGFGLALF